MIKIPGQPVPKARPRLNANHRPYTPPKTKEAEIIVRLITQHAVRIKKLTKDTINLPVELTAEFVLSKSQKQHAYHTIRPDIDNLLKTVLDGMNSVAYCNDAQIIAVNARKRFANQGEQPHTKLILTYIQNVNTP